MILIIIIIIIIIIVIIIIIILIIITGRGVLIHADVACKQRNKLNILSLKSKFSSSTSRINAWVLV